MKWKILVSFHLCSTFTMWFTAVGAEQFYCDFESESDPNDFSMRDQHDHNNLTYKITSYTNKLSRSEVNDVIAEAFNAWSAVTDLTFRKIDSGKPDIDIKFAEQNHTCRKAFDGPQGVVAHAAKSYVHFDESENWSTQINSDSVNLYSIAVHEIGHSLGLGHSTFVQSIMYRAYRPRNVIMKLHRDDIDGIQILYGAKTTSDEIELASCLLRLGYSPERPSAPSSRIALSNSRFFCNGPLHFAYAYKKVDRSSYR